jgi:hypothetical protein
LARLKEIKMDYLNIKGSQGSWLTEVTWANGSKQMLPTAHEEFIADKRTMQYRRHDEHMAQYPGKLKAWTDALHTSTYSTSTTCSLMPKVPPIASASSSATGA